MGIYISANVRTTNLDQSLPNPTLAQSPMQIIHFDLFGPSKQSSFAGHYCGVFVDDHSRHTWVYTVNLRRQAQIRSTGYIQKVLCRYSNNSQQIPTVAFGGTMLAKICLLIKKCGSLITEFVLNPPLH